MKSTSPALGFIATVFATLVFAAAVHAQTPSPPPAEIVVSWDKTVAVSRATPTLQVVVNPMIRRGSTMHDGTFAALKALHADYVRFVPWFPYPRLVVPELEPPTRTATSWDFSLIDPMVADFMEAVGGRTTVMNFSTIPAWMFKTEKPVPYPAQAEGVTWDYVQGTELRDPSLKELGDYYARLVSWYVDGGFNDENGRRHESGLHYQFPVWEVLNELDFEHATTPKQYTERYDAIVEAIRRVSPKTRFMALALGDPSHNGAIFEYFLNPANHKSGIPLDYISYHFYANPASTEGPDTWQYSFFDQADRFLAEIRYIELVRKRLSPATRTDLDEIGTILPGDPGTVDGPAPNIPDVYWNASGALFAYVFANAGAQGIELIGESQLVGYPSQYPSVTMIDWRNSRPNARYWVLKLLMDHFHPGDTVVECYTKGDDSVFAEGFIAARGRSLLLVNKRNRTVDVALPAGRWDAQTVDAASGESPPRDEHPGAGTFRLGPFGVTILTARE